MRYLSWHTTCYIEFFIYIGFFVYLTRYITCNIAHTQIRPHQAGITAPLRLAFKLQTRTCTSGPSRYWACNAEAWAIPPGICRQPEPEQGPPGPGIPGMDLIKIFEESIKIDLKYLRPRFAEKGPSMSSGKEPQLPVLVLADGWIHQFWQLLLYSTLKWQTLLLTRHYFFLLLLLICRYQ